MKDYSEINKKVFKEYFEEHPEKLFAMQEVARAILFGGNATFEEFSEMLLHSEHIDRKNNKSNQNDEHTN